MLRHEIEEKLAERLVKRITETNTFILTKIGNAIKEISTLTPSQAYQLSQILKYGGSYEEMARELARISGKNVQEIYEIFDKVAEENKQFAKEFYKYRGIDFIPYSKDSELRKQVESLANLTAKSYINITRTKGIGFLFENLDGQLEFKNIKQSYYEIIDRAVLSVSQGKETYQSEMRRIMKQMGQNGLVLYDSGRTRRLDSAVRMNMLDGIRQLNIETNKRFGEEYGADGVEITVHSNPAPDHADIQGRQFSTVRPSKNELSEFEKIEAGQTATDYKGVIFESKERRHIGELNCYHGLQNIVLGVSKPQYTDEQLKKIIDDNNKGFEFEGKHYTNYEGTQLQRRLELEIRKNKDTQILQRASGFKEDAQASELKIRQLTDKYNKLCKASGLPSQKQRMSVSRI